MTLDPPARPLAIAAAAALAATASAPALALDVLALWDFANPELSERRFRDALAGARGDDALILHTQIARTHGLRGDFERARDVLRGIEPQLAGAGAEARVRHALELGRTFASARHAPASQTDAAREQARAAYRRAIELARAHRLDALAVDALHMMAFVDTAPADQVRWGREAMALALASSQPDARRWEASLRNNIAHSLNDLGRHDEALAELRAALALRQQGGNAQAIHVAHWMVARTLRSLSRIDEALEIQLRLERERDAAGAPDPHVFEELEALYRAKGDAAAAARYAERKKRLATP